MARQIKLVREGEYVAEVEVELIEEGEGWGPYLSLEDVDRLDVVRSALMVGNIEDAMRLFKVFRLVPVTVDLGNK